MPDALLKAQGVCFSYGGRPVLREVGWELSPGEFCSIIGPNGSGKTTLLGLLWGGRPCAAGQICFEGREVSSIPLAQRARLFAVVHQGARAAFPFTCRELVTLGLHPHRPRFGPPSPRLAAWVEELLCRIGLEGLADTPVTQISGGELQRVELARALAQRPRVLFLDEAMSELDVSAKIQMTKLLRELMDRTGMSVAAVNHDLASAFRCSDRVLALKEGRVAAFGRPAQVMDEAFFARVFGVKAQVHANQGFFIQDTI